MAADPNQLQDLREFLLAVDEDSARRLTENLNPSSLGKWFTRVPATVREIKTIPRMREQRKKGLKHQGLIALHGFMGSKINFSQ